MGLRVLWVASEYYPATGGVQRWIAECIDALSDSCEVFLVTGVGQHLVPGQRAKHAAALDLRHPRDLQKFDLLGDRLVSLIQEHRIDVVHFAGAGISCYARYIPSAIPIFATVYCNDLTHPWQRAPRGLSVRDLMRDGLLRARRVFCISEFTLSHVRRIVGDKVRTEILTPGVLPVEPSNWRPSTPLPRTRIITVARAVRRKGHEELLRGLELIKRPFIWEIVGDGPYLPEIASRVHNSKIANRTRIHGLLSPEELEKIWGSASLFAMTPIVQVDDRGVDAEGFGLVYLEAAMRGLPTIASDCGGCADAVADKKTGFLVDPHDPHGIGRAVNRLLKRPDEALQLGANGRQRALADFRWEARATTLLKHYAAATSN